METALGSPRNYAGQPAIGKLDADLLSFVYRQVQIGSQGKELRPMIYLILVDNRQHVTDVGPSFVAASHRMRALLGDSDPDHLSRRVPLKHRVFFRSRKLHPVRVQIDVR